jgi:hypothetical protein
MDSSIEKTDLRMNGLTDIKPGIDLENFIEKMDRR